jgi:flagellar biosynthesis protein FlhA
MQALQTYTLLTVGEGLVNQIPALLISTATGLVVTRAASENNLGHDIAAQLLAYPRVFFLVAAVLTLLSAVPGLPGIPFVSIAIVIAGLGYVLQKTAQTAAETEVGQQEEKEREEVRKPESIVSLLQVDPIELEIGYSLIPLVDVAQGGNLLDRVVMIRRQCALEMGIVVPTIRIRDNIQLKPSAYVIKIKGIEVAKGELLLDHFLAMNPGTVSETIPGEETVEPAFGLPAIWINETYRERAEMSGYTVVDPISVLATHLTEVVKGHSDELLGRQDVQTLIDSVKQDHPAVVSELVPAMMSLGDIQKVLVCLLRERVSVRDLVTIMETLADSASFTKDPEILAEYVRRALSRNITRQYIQNNTITCLTLEPQTENLIVSAAQHTERGSFVSLDPGAMQQFIASLSKELQKLTSAGFQPILLTSPASRLYVRKLTERIAPNLVILSFAELENQIEIQSLGMVKI